MGKRKMPAKNCHFTVTKLSGAGTFAHAEYIIKRNPSIS